MKLAYTTVLTFQKQDKIVHLSVAQKQSQSGLTSNQRLLILIQDHSFGYISKFNIKDDPKSVDLSTIKQSVPIKFIKAVDYDHQNLLIKFLQIQKSKSQQKVWVFRMSNQTMIKAWFQLFQQQKVKRALQSSSKAIPNKVSSPNISPNKSNKANQAQTQRQDQVSHILTNQNGQRKTPNRPNKQFLNVIQEQQPQKKQFINPLYTGYHSSDSQIVLRNNSQVLQTLKSKLQPSPPQEMYHPRQSASGGRQNSFVKKQISQPDRSQSVYYVQDKNSLKSKEEQSQQHQNSREQKEERPPDKPRSSSPVENPKSNYIQMIHGIIQRTQLNNQQTCKEGPDCQSDPSNQCQEQQKPGNYEQILSDFLKYKPGQTKQWRQSNMKSQFNQNYEQSTESRCQNKKDEGLEALQQYAMNLQMMEQKRNLQKRLKQPLNYSSFSEQIAHMIRNRTLQANIPQQQPTQTKEPHQKYSIKNMPFSYRYLLASSSLPPQQQEEDLMDVMTDWKAYCEQIMQQLVVDMVRGQGKFVPKEKKNNIVFYQFQEVQIKLSLAFLKNVQFKIQSQQNNQQPIKQKKQEKISDYCSAKDIQIQFKNFIFLNQLLQKNQLPQKLISQTQSNLKTDASNHSRSKLKVPLCAIVEYYGYIALFKLCPKFSNKSATNSQYIKKKQDHVIKISNISTNWTKDPSMNQDKSENNSQKTTLILPIDWNYYTQLHLERTKQLNMHMNRRPSEVREYFQVDVLHEVGNFLLKDYLTKSLTNGVLRKQLISQMADRDEYNNVVFMNPSSINNPGDKAQIQANLTLLSGQILQKLSYSILKLDSLSFYYLHPQQLSAFLHKQGINIRYIGLAYENLNEPYTKRFLITQISARVCKLLLRKTIQDVLSQIGKQNQKNPQLKQPKTGVTNQNTDIDILGDIIDFLNCILGEGYESSAMWNVLQLHSQYYFKSKINREQIDKGYFLISLAHHCRLNINWKKIKQIATIFKTQDFFNRENILGLRVKSKTYEPFLSNTYSKLIKYFPSSNQRSITKKQQKFNSILKQLSLQVRPLPSNLSCLQQSSPLSLISLKQFLCQFVRPQSIKLSSTGSNFSHLHLFSNLNDLPTQKTISIKITQIEWYIQMKKRQKYIKKFQQLVNLFNKFIGDYSPFLTKVYDIFSNFHLSLGQYQNAITFSKSSLVNMLKICGTNHTKTAQAYYNLSLCYLRAKKTQDAYQMLKKSKTIFQSKQKTLTYKYAITNLKFGLLMINRNQISQSIQAIEKALQTFEQLTETDSDIDESEVEVIQKQVLSKYEDQKTQCYEALYRCYWLKRSKQDLGQLSKRIQENFLAKIISAINLQRILQMTLHPYISPLSKVDSGKYIQLISLITNLYSLLPNTPKTYYLSSQQILLRISQKSLVSNFQNYMENFCTIYDYIQINHSVEGYRSFEQKYQRQTVNDFVALTDQLIYFLGGEYLTKILRQNMKDVQIQ